jgi:hypothetical protein
MAIILTNERVVLTWQLFLLPARGLHSWLCAGGDTTNSGKYITYLDFGEA